MQTDQKNLILAIALSMAILLGWEVLFPTVPPPPPAPTAASTKTGAAPGVPAPPKQLTRTEAVGGPDRVRIDTPSLHGSINLRGARFDDLTLVRYRQTPSPTSPEIELLSPTGTGTPYFAQFGWTAEGKTVPVPGHETLWSASDTVLTVDKPLVLTWDNGAGLTFVTTIAVDRHYMFSIKREVRNGSGEAVALRPYGRILRGYLPVIEDFFILHEGPLGVMNSTLEEADYGDLQEEDGRVQKSTTGGWVGITDKYWLTALAFDQRTPTLATMRYVPEGRRPRYQVDYIAEALTVAPGETGAYAEHFFAGAKEVRLIDGYATALSIDRFDLAIDFGWFIFLTKPFFFALQWIHDLVGNFGVAILVFTVLIKLVFFYPATKSYKAMSHLKKLQPEMKKIQERYKDDRVKLQQELMALYKKEGANPLAGCLPILIQIPVFFALYKVLFVTIEMRHAPFFGWIQDLSAPDPSNIFTLFGLIPWEPWSFLHLGAWPLLMGVTMWLQQKLNPAPTDPIQARMMMILPFVFTIMLAGFPAGLVIYWAWNNTLSIAQQWVIMKRMGIKDPTA